VVLARWMNNVNCATGSKACWTNNGKSVNYVNYAIGENCAIDVSYVNDVEPASLKESRWPL
jgi:hypothetical protein